MADRRLLVLFSTFWIAAFGFSTCPLSARQSTRVYSIDWSQDGKYIAAQFRDSIRVYDQNLTELGIISVQPFGDVAWSPDSSRLAFFYIGQQYFFEVRAVNDLQTPLVNLQVRGTGGGGISWNPDGSQTAITEIITEMSASGEIISLTTGTPVINADTGAVIYDLPADPLVSPKIIAWSPDGDYIAGSEGGEQIIVWNAVIGTVSKVLSAPPRAAYLVWSPDGSILAQSFSNGVALWDIKNEQIIRKLISPSRLGAVGRLLSWQEDVLIAEDFNADRQTLYFWRASTGEMLQAMDTSADPIYALALSTDGTKVVYGGADGILHIMPVPTSATTTAE